MTKDNWQQLEIGDKGALAAALRQAHTASQWQARAGWGLIEARPDDSHYNLGWIADLNAFATNELPDGSRLALRIADLTLMIVKQDAIAAKLSLHGLTDAGIRQWLGEQFTAAGLDAAKLDEVLPYDMPGGDRGADEAYDAEGPKEALGELSNWFANADMALNQVVADYSGPAPGPSPVRCWPHFFDIATLISLDGDDAENQRTIGAGMSPGDDNFDEPYFYISLWPVPDQSALTELPAIGYWRSEGFTGAVAPAETILTSANQGADMAEFLREAVAISVKAHGA